MTISGKNKICNNEESTNKILGEIIANQERHPHQVTLTTTVAKPDVPRLCPKTCKHKKNCDGCHTFSKFESISKAEYDQLQKGVGSIYLNKV